MVIASNVRIKYPLVNLKTLRSFEKLSIITTINMIGFLLLTFSAFANDGLTDIFRTQSFQGSWEVINKFNWVGWLMNTVISIFCLVGLCMVFYQRLITLLYLSSRALFDNVYDMKNQAKGNSFFGFGAMGRDVFQGNRGVGMDAIIGVFYALLPDVKRYSDYNPEKMAYNLSEEDNVATYMLKTALPTVLLVFFFSIGFSGTLAKAYGTVVDGMSAFADKAVSVNLEGYVNKLMNSGEAYRFTIGDNNSAEGKFAEKVGTDIYGRVLSRMDVLDTESRMVVGQAVESWTWTNVLGGGYGNKGAYTALTTLAKTGKADTSNISVANEADVKALSYDIVVNTNSTMMGTSKSVAMTEFTKSIAKADNGIGSKLYVHLIVRKDKVSNANFFKVNKEQ